MVIYALLPVVGSNGSVTCSMEDPRRGVIPSTSTVIVFEIISSGIIIIVHDIVYDVVYDIVYEMWCYPLSDLNTFLQDTLCLVALYPFRLEPLQDFDPLTDFDMTGGDDVWFARPQLFFIVQPVPYWTDGRQGLSCGSFAGVLQHI